MDLSLFCLGFLLRRGPLIRTHLPCRFFWIVIGSVIRIVSWVRCSGFFSGSLSSDRGSSWPQVEVSSRVSDCISHCKPIPLYLLLLLLVLNWSHGIYCCTRVSASTWPSKIIYNILDLLGELVKLILIATDHCRETHLFSCRCCCVEKAE